MIILSSVIVFVPLTVVLAALTLCLSRKHELVVVNESTTVVESFRLSGCVDLQIGPIGTGDKTALTYWLEKEGELAASWVQDGKEHRVVVDEFIVPGKSPIHRRRLIITIRSDAAATVSEMP